MHDDTPRRRQIRPRYPKTRTKRSARLRRRRCSNRLQGDTSGSGSRRIWDRAVGRLLGATGRRRSPGLHRSGTLGKPHGGFNGYGPRRRSPPRVPSVARPWLAGCRRARRRVRPDPNSAPLRPRRWPTFAPGPSGAPTRASSPDPQPCAAVTPYRAPAAPTLAHVRAAPPRRHDGPGARTCEPAGTQDASPRLGKPCQLVPGSASVCPRVTKPSAHSGAHSRPRKSRSRPIGRFSAELGGVCDGSCRTRTCNRSGMSRQL